MKKSFFSERITKTKFFFFFLIFVGLNSCEKENMISDPCQDKSKIRQVKADDFTMEEITYTGNCRVYEFIEAFSYKRYSYNSLDQLVKVELALSLNPLSCFMQPASSDEVYTNPRKAKINSKG